MAGELAISKPKSYEAARYFEAKGHVSRSHTVGNRLNIENRRAKPFLRDLKVVAEEYYEDSN